MAKLNQHANLIFEKPANFTGLIPRKVGNNRDMQAFDMVTRDKAAHDAPENGSGSYRVSCTLHGNEVVRVEYIDHKPKLISLATCGWLTETTQAAMNDFIAALPHDIAHNFSRVGRAKGELSVVYQGMVHVDPDGETLEIWV